MRAEGDEGPIPGAYSKLPAFSRYCTTAWEGSRRWILGFL